MNGAVSRADTIIMMFKGFYTEEDVDPECTDLEEVEEYCRWVEKALLRKKSCSQIDTAVVDKSVNHDEFLEIWRINNPSRVMRTVITMEYETDFAFIILHHQKN